MISKEIINYSLRSLSKRKSRSFLTIVSIMIGIAAIFIFVSFGIGLYSYVHSFISSGNADKILIQSKGSSAGLGTSLGLTGKDLTAVERTSGVFDATGYYTQAGEIQSQGQNKYAFVIGYDPKKGYLLDQATNLKIGQGRELQTGNDADVVLGYDYEVNNKIFQKGLKVNDLVTIQGQKLKVVGFYQQVGDGQDDSNIYITSSEFQKMYPNVTNYYMIIARVNPANLTLDSNNIEKSLLASRNLKPGQQDFTVESFQSLLDSYSSALNIVIGFIILIALISVFVSAINTSNTMITSVLERMKEIGVIKSIGARNSEVLTLFLFESSFLGLIAGVAGTFLGFGLTTLAGYILSGLGLGFLQPGYSVWLFLGCILFATLTGAISGTIPAIHASKTNPVEALRYE